MTTPFQHNNIERSTTKVWTNEFIADLVEQMTIAEYDIRFVDTEDEGFFVVGIKETDQVFLKALRHDIKGSDWVVRYDQKLFDENFTE